jgi:pimeloyl-ACP methyl ester carboxylesterase
LGEHFRCILGDNRGVGATDKPAGPYTTAMMADDYAGLMDALGIKKARVVGCSLGSVIAQQLALRHPSKVQSAILMCTWARQDRFGFYTWQHLMNCKATMRPEDFMHYVQMLIFTKPWFDNDDCWNNMQQGLKDAAINSAPQPVHAMEAQCAAAMSHNTTRSTT